MIKAKSLGSMFLFGFLLDPTGEIGIMASLADRSVFVAALKLKGCQPDRRGFLRGWISQNGIWFPASYHLPTGQVNIKADQASFFGIAGAA